MKEFITYDTHSAIEYLIGTGIKKSQAEAIIMMQQRSKEIDLRELVTKDYLKAELAFLRNEMSNMEKRLIIWLLGIAGVGFASMISVMIWVLQTHLPHIGG